MIRPRRVHEGEDRLGVDRHLGLGPLEAVAREDLLVVDDDPVVDPDDRSVADRVVVREDRGVALRVVAHVDERVRRVARQLDGLEQGRRPGALLVDRDVRAGTAVRVADRIGAALGDPREERLGGERAIDAGVGVEAVSGDPAHQRIRSPRSDMTH